MGNIVGRLCSHPHTLDYAQTPQAETRPALPQRPSPASTLPGGGPPSRAPASVCPATTPRRAASLDPASLRGISSQRRPSEVQRSLSLDSAWFLGIREKPTFIPDHLRDDWTGANGAAIAAARGKKIAEAMNKHWKDMPNLELMAKYAILRGQLPEATVKKAISYLDRIAHRLPGMKAESNKEKGNSLLDGKNALMASLMHAHKALEDHSYSGKDWTKISCVLKDIKRLNMANASESDVRAEISSSERNVNRAVRHYEEAKKSAPIDGKKAPSKAVLALIDEMKANVEAELALMQELDPDLIRPGSIKSALEDLKESEKLPPDVVTWANTCLDAISKARESKLLGEDDPLQNEKRAVMASLMLAHKLKEEEFYPAETWAKISANVHELFDDSAAGKDLVRENKEALRAVMRLFGFIGKNVHPGDWTSKDAGLAHAHGRLIASIVPGGGYKDNLDWTAGHAIEKARCTEATVTIACRLLEEIVKQRPSMVDDHVLKDDTKALIASLSLARKLVQDDDDKYSADDWAQASSDPRNPLSGKDVLLAERGLRNILTG
jgi:hypothetical protein